MSRFRTFLNWLGFGSAETDFEAWIARQPMPAISFSEITDVALPPPNEAVRPNTFYRVMRNDQSKWALFLCPCGCGAVITLSLQFAHWPHWTVRASKNRRPSMRPSVWRDIGCLSHFWIEDGCIYWCSDTGISPIDARRHD
ncbi:MAG: DUF6527 family protein [Sulfuricaulis sp.]